MSNCLKSCACTCLGQFLIKIFSQLLLAFLTSQTMPRFSSMDAGFSHSNIPDNRLQQYLLRNKCVHVEFSLGTSHIPISFTKKSGNLHSDYITSSHINLVMQIHCILIIACGLRGVHSDDKFLSKKFQPSNKQIDQVTRPHEQPAVRASLLQICALTPFFAWIISIHTW